MMRAPPMHPAKETRMKKMLAAAMCTGMLWGVAAHAGDTAPKDAKHEQMMRECMAKQDPSMGKDEATKVCTQQMKALQDAKKADLQKSPDHP
jgi:hypothetical protein